MERVDVAVVGSGLLGSATARALGARGVSAVVLEQFGLGHARGSSHGATRIFRLSYPDPAYVRMAAIALGGWARLQEDAGERLLVRTGGLDTGPGAMRCAAALRRRAVAHSWLSASQVRERFPGIEPRPGERMLFQPDSGVCLAGPAVAALQRLARRDGVPIRPHSPVLGIDHRADRVVLRTPTGEISAGVAVIAAGPWSERLLAGDAPPCPAANGDAAAGALLPARRWGRSQVADADRVVARGADLVCRADDGRRARREGGHPRSRPGR